MKIIQVRSQIVALPADEPLADGKGSPESAREYVVVEIATSDGIEGIGVTGFGGALTAALKSAVDALGALVVGENPARIEHILAKLNTAAGGAGPAGVFTLAACALDLALWDIRGKATGKSLSNMLGGHRETVPAYASGALMRSQSLDDVVRAARLLVERGWTSMKTQLALPGATTPAKEVERLRLIREAIGPDIQLMCDINQRWSVPQAISIGDRLAPFHLHWLEDVTRCDDYSGIARVRDKLTTRIACGEYVWGIVPFKCLLEAGSVDFAMIDLMRVGGITPWLKVAGMAEAFNVPVVSHLLPEIHVHLIAAIPNGDIVEYMPWTLGLFEDPPWPVKGVMTVPTGPGLGLRFTKKIEAGFKRG